MALRSTQALVKMSTRNISWGKRRPVREADNLNTFMCRMSWRSGSLRLLELSGPHRACYGTLYTFSYPNWFRGEAHSRLYPKVNGDIPAGRKKLTFSRQVSTTKILTPHH